MPNLIHLCCSHQRICWYNFEACSYCQDAATVMQTAGVRLCHNTIVSFLPCNTCISLWHQPGIFKTKIIVGIYKAIATWRNCGPQNRALVLGIITYKTVNSWSHSNNYHKLWWQVCCCTSLGSNHHLSGERWSHLPKSSQLHAVGMLMLRKQQWATRSRCGPDLCLTIHRQFSGEVWCRWGLQGPSAEMGQIHSWGLLGIARCDETPLWMWVFSSLRCFFKRHLSLPRDGEGQCTVGIQQLSCTPFGDI